MLFPVRCGCGRVGELPCRSCAAELTEAGPFSIPGLDFCWAPFGYEGTAGELIRAMKYGGNRAVVHWAVKELTVGAHRHTWSGSATRRTIRTSPAPVLVTWIPASTEGRQRRGFDQGELLARSVARRLGLPSRALLTRPSSAVGSRSQTRANRRDRLDGPGLELARPAFRMRSRVSNRLASLMVLIVDDVITTGSSMTEAASRIRAAGAVTVGGLALARADRQPAPRSALLPAGSLLSEDPNLGIASANGRHNQSSPHRVVSSS